MQGTVTAPEEELYPDYTCGNHATSQKNLVLLSFVFSDICLCTEKNSAILLFTIGPTDSSACFVVVVFSLTVLKTFRE